MRFPYLFISPLESRRLLSGYTLSALAGFDEADGQNPQAGLIADAAGNLYGTASQGGASGDGTVFEVASGSSAVTTLANFDSNGTDGTNPNSGLVMDADGNLYGTTEDGGADGEGTVFEVAQGSGAATTLASFDETNGAGPVGDLVMDAAGNLFGTAEAGGVDGVGTLFEVAKDSGNVTALANFDGTNGASPTSGLIADAAGNLYGTTSFGGSADDGTVFELPAGYGAVGVLASFDGINGASPSNGLIVDSAGDLFGTASVGGAANDGTVFEVAAGSGAVTALASFNGTNGSIPNSPLVMDSAGNLYGTASQGGASNVGTVFEVAAGTGPITALASFDGTNGAGPSAGLYLDVMGNLYGTAAGGGDANGDGTVFELSNAPPPAPVSTPTSTPTPTPTSTPAPTTTPTPAPTSTPTPLPTGTLGVSVSASLPADAIGGAKAKARALVTVSNRGKQAISGTATVTLYLSPAASLDGATQLLAVTPKLKLKAGAHTELRLKLSSFPSLPMGSYSLIATVTGPDGTTTGVAGPSLTITPPFVSVVVSDVRPSTASVAPGKKTSLALMLKDTGNETASGTAALTISASTDSSGTGSTDITSVPLDVKLKAGESKTSKLKFAVPALPAGRYYLTVSLDVAALGDSTTADGFAVSTLTLTVK